MVAYTDTLPLDQYGGYKEAHMSYKIVGLVAFFIFFFIVGGVPCSFAEDRPIRHLPQDFLRFSTAWMAIPKEMFRVNHRWGPFVAILWGPVKGSARFVHSAGKECWDIMKTDDDKKHRPSRKAKSIHGMVVSYEF